MIPTNDQKETPTTAKLEQAFQATMEKLAPFKRTAYIPTTAVKPHSFSTHSKIGGYPYLRNEQDWPVCPNCKKNMQLFVQLNLAELPTQQEDGLIQLFYCTNSGLLCEGEMQAYIPFSKSVVCRKIAIEGSSASTKPVLDELFEEKHITSWTAKDDYPSQEEYESLNIDLDIYDDVFEDIYMLMEERETGLPLDGDKLFGWPHWIQSLEYPYDRVHKVRMELLFQLDSEVNLPFMFGDVGVGHLTQSPKNPNELGFGWACG